MDLTNKFPLDKIKDILLVALKNINNMKLLTEGVSKDVSEEYGEFSLSAGGEAAITIQLFNDPDDDNNDPLAASLELDKEISNDFTFISYEVLGKIKGGLKGDLDYMTLGLNKVNEISHKSFLKHKSSETLAQAIAKDLTKFKVAFDWNSIANLENYETISVWSKGVLDINAEVSVSDTFTPLMSGISKLLNATDGVSVKMDMSASLKVNVNISDFFQTVIQRRDEKDKKLYSINIRKESKSLKSATAAIGVTAAISNPQVMIDFIHKIINRGQNTLVNELDKLKGKAFSKLTDKERARVEEGAKLIGLDPAKIEGDLLKKYTERRDEIIAKIKSLVESEIKFSVSYSYEQIKESKSLLKAMFTESSLKNCFSNLLRLRVKDIYFYAKENPREITVNDYVDMTRISITKAMKIGFSVGDFELSQLMKRSLEFEDQILFDRNSYDEIQSVNFTSTKFTAEKFGVFKERENSMMLSGSYRNSAKPDIFMQDLDYEFALHWAETYKNPKDANLRKIVDFATTWGIIDEKSFEDQLTTIASILKDRRKVKVNAFLKIKEGIFDSLVDPIISLSDYTFQQALAASVPYADYDGRQSPSARRDLYYSFFNAYLKEKDGSDIDYDRVKEIIVKHLQANNKTRLAEFEESGDNKYTPLNKLLEYNFMAFNFSKFKNAIELLNNFKKDFKAVIKSAEFLRNLHSIKLQPEFNMRFLGRLMLQLATDKGIDSAVERTLIIEYKDNNDKDVKYVMAK